MTVLCSQQQSKLRLALSMVMVFIGLHASNAYSQWASSSPVLGRPRNLQTTRLSMAWSIPTPTFSAQPFGTWYNEVNPTARRTVYDDSVPLEYTFVSSGYDWPSAYDSAVTNASKSSTKRTRMNPLRRAANWAFRGLPRKNQS